MVLELRVDVEIRIRTAEGDLERELSASHEMGEADGAKESSKELVEHDGTRSRRGPPTLLFLCLCHDSLYMIS